MKAPRALRRSEILRRTMAPSVETLVRTELLLWTDGDPETVHAARIAARRLRSALRLFGSALDPAWLAEMTNELRDLGQRLGAIRDVDVLVRSLADCAQRLSLEDRGAAAEIVTTLGAVREELGRALSADVRAERYGALFAELVEAARGGPPFAVDDDPIARDRLTRSVMVGPWRRLTKAVARHADDPSPARLHRVRIKAKEARYAAEALVPFVRRRRRAAARKVARRLRLMQDELGAAHDAAVADRRLRETAVSDRFVSGLLAAFAAVAGDAACAAWKKAWHKASRGRQRFWR